MWKQIRKLFTRADIILIIFLLIFSGVFLFALRKNLTQKEVEIHYHNKLVHKTLLSKDQVFIVDEGIEVEIRNGKVRMKASTCKHHYCVNQGWSSNLPIFCVPNELSIVIKGETEEQMLITR